MQKLSKFFSGKGFTIIELIVVIAIIAVLATVITSATVVYLSRAKDAKIKAEVSQIAKKLQAYYSENDSRFPLESDWPETSGMGNYGFRADPSSNAFIVYSETKLSDNKYFEQDSTGATGSFNIVTESGYTIGAGVSDFCSRDSDCPNCNCVSNRCVPCPGIQNCSVQGESHVCVDCVPDCTNKCNGDDDGCGGTCPVCTSPAICYEGTCCTPQSCDGKCDNASDGCGGVCNYNCSWPSFCYENSCCSIDCAGKCGGSDGCGGTCPDNCSWPSYCYNNSCCAHDCTGKCGGASDGCGGTCDDVCPCVPNCDGICGGAQNSCNTGPCDNPCCQPSCNGKCDGASDNCGGNCWNACDLGQHCDNYSCVNDY